MLCFCAQDLNHFILELLQSYKPNPDADPFLAVKRIYSYSGKKEAKPAQGSLSPA